jgi:hypothetical protein
MSLPTPPPPSPTTRRASAPRSAGRSSLLALALILLASCGGATPDEAARLAPLAHEPLLVERPPHATEIGRSVTAPHETPGFDATSGQIEVVYASADLAGAVRDWFLGEHGARYAWRADIDLPDRVVLVGHRGPVTARVDVSANGPPAGDDRADWAKAPPGTRSFVVVSLNLPATEVSAARRRPR